ncbi:MAG: hypothetical protein AAGF28_06980 [Pseudomonadota bacterium]
MKHFSQIDGLLDFSKQRIEQIFKEADGYNRQYDALLSLAASNALPSDVQHTLLGLATYGWMPTIPKSQTEEPYLDKVVSLNSAAAVDEFLERLKKPVINNSWVGTSKILHFANPVWFPIWDSKVGSVVGIKRHSINIKRHYLAYVLMMRELVTAHEEAAIPLKQAMFDKYGYRPSSLRCFELNLFVGRSKS